MSVSKLMDIAKQGIQVHRTAVDLASHNIANVNNPNYSRQRIIFGTRGLEDFYSGVVGGGVKIQDLLRVRDSLLDKQIREYNSQYSNHNKRSETLGQIETLFTEPSDLGFGNLMNEFFNSFNELAVTPNSLPLRGQVVGKANQLIAKVNSINDGIQNIKANSLQEAKDKVIQMNSLVKQVQELNKQIFMTDVSGHNASDLMDERDAAVAELSKIVNVQIFIDDKGSYNLSVGGVFAADRYHYNEFKVEEADGVLSIRTADDAARIMLNGGELFALTNLYNKRIPDYQTKFDSIVQTLVDKVNEIHYAGFSIHDPPLTGIDFFSGYVERKLSINPLIQEDAKHIAVSVDGTSGNGELALQIFDLTKDKTLLNGRTLSENYTDLINELGSEKLYNEKNAENNQVVLDQLEIQQASVSGVSLDEEMTNIIAFQKSYEASAKLIQVASDMLKTLINAV